MMLILGIFIIVMLIAIGGAVMFGIIRVAWNVVIPFVCLAVVIILGISLFLPDKPAPTPAAQESVQPQDETVRVNLN